MDASTLIERNLLDKKTLAATAGLSHNYVRQLSKTEPRSAGPDARRALANAFRKRASQLVADADALENGGGS